MGKFDIDDILNDLGVSPDAPAESRRRAPGSGTSGATADTVSPTKRHRIDEASDAFSPLPAVPSGQRSFDREVVVEDDPAVPVRPAETPQSNVGHALAEVFNPGDEAGVPVLSGRALGEFLLSAGAVTPQQYTAAQQVLRASPGRRLTEVLIEQGADEIAVYKALAQFADVPFERVDLDKGLDGGFDGGAMQRLGIDFCKQHTVLPLRQTGQGRTGAPSRLVVGATNPDDVFLIDEIRRRVGGTAVKIVVCPPNDIRAAIEIVGVGEQKDLDISEILSDVDEGDVQVEKAKENQEVDLEAQAAESPVIRYVNFIIQTAVKEGASDIHIEPAEKRLKVRFRIDGVLFEMMNPPASMSSAIISRLKIMANLDISERRLPQDGRIRCTVGGRKLDLRMSTLPNGYGEKVVLRILDTKSINVELGQLGFSEDALTLWTKAIDEPHGIVLVTGPTGSGKTTTLYASLRTLDKISLNISTVEDPVEYHLDGITQTQTHEKIGMSFAKALKALLRQDPDVIMLGEIRDLETAQTAVQAALTGHLVLSTLHTNDAPSSITRLVNIGIEPFLVGAAVRAVLAQRLVRRLCQHCKSNEQPSPEFAEYLAMQGMDPDGVWIAKGCEKCRNTGYSGRVGIYELLMVDDQLRDIVARNPNVAEFRKLCIERGMVTLRGDGMTKVAKGLTTVEEILRVTEAAG
ncbi:MAG: Flp pilus assembly complex ATPase component TadA [Phycisphaeraceae bacterium]|nr:Flp pilus assembly complex ATPase component TadA [Phycisphaeraceae bacterium]